MKLKVILVLPVLLWGCSKETARQTSDSNIAPKPVIAQQPQPVSSPALPFQLTVVETTETKEQNEIKEQAKTLLAAKKYGELDQLAQKYRVSKECYANCLWKLYVVYLAFKVSNEEPEVTWQNRAAELEAWMKAKPESATAHMAMADFLTSYAWKARGSGYADTVTEEGWRLFNTRLNQAVDVLKKAENLKERCPCWWSFMMQTGIGLSIEKPQFEKLFTEAIRSEPAYFAYYVRRSIYLLPRWHGEDGEWENALTKSADKLGDGEGDLLYARVVWAMNEYGAASKNIFKECRVSSDRVDRGFEIMEQRFPDSLCAKSARAYFACLSGKQQTARTLFDKIDGRVDLTVWITEQKFRRFAQWAYSQ